MKSRTVVSALAALALLGSDVDPAWAQLEGADHYLCWRGRVPAGDLVAEVVTLTDQFGRSRVPASDFGLCNPADKLSVDGKPESFPIFEPIVHLTWLRIRRGSRPAQTVTVRNQFGDTVLEATRAVALLVPAQKTPGGGDMVPIFPPLPFDSHPVDNFECYNTDVISGPTPTVEVTDQYHTEEIPKSTYLLQPDYLCNPTDKTRDNVTEERKNPARHLLCYRPRRIPGERTRGQRGRRLRQIPFVHFKDQFGSRTFTASRPWSFCVPSEKFEDTPPPPPPPPPAAPVCNEQPCPFTATVTLTGAGGALPIAFSGTVDVLCGNTDPDPTTGECTCNLELVAPVEIPIPTTSFSVCATPLPPGTCPPGPLDCDGGSDNDLTVVSDHEAGLCLDDAECAANCTAQCAGLGMAPFQHKCELAADPHPGACNCTCVGVGDGVPDGPGHAQLNLAANIRVEVSPCDGAGVVGEEVACVPMTTGTATSTLLDFNASPGSVLGPTSTTGSPFVCPDFAAGVTTGVGQVTEFGFFDSSLGDVNVELALSCL